MAIAASTKLLDRTFAILRLFLTERPDWTLAQVTAAVGLPKPTVHRLLGVMCAHEMLKKSPDQGSYRLGPLAMAIGGRAVSRHALRQLGQPILTQLAARAGETALLFELAPSRDATICIEQIESSHGLRLVSYVGARLPLHAGASSRAILAFMPDDEIAAVLALSARRGASPGRAELARQIQWTRRQGYAQSFEETSSGACGIAAPLFDAAGAPIASLAIAGPTSRLTRTRLAQLAPDLLAAAATLMRRLGGLPPEPAVRRAAARPSQAGLAITMEG
jgi:DNA-binding IclR family transcriptional regulator